MAKRLKRAFTIVELVIVIAVIAILAAVLIPTFTTLIDKANESNDIALVKNLNTALVSKEATDEVNTMQDALDAAYEYGYTVDKLTPSSSGDIVWDEANNRFALINEKKEVVFEDGAKPLTNDATKIWKIVTELAGTQDYSWYVGGLSKEAIEGFKFTMGVDTGSVEADVNYVTAAVQDVTIRTAGGALTVNAEKATVSHYGTAQSVDVQAVAGNSYHEYGKVTGNLTITKGHVVFESTAVVNTFVVSDEATAVKATVNDKAQVLTAVAKDNNILTGLNLPATVETVVAEMDDLAMFAGGAGTEKSPYLIENEVQFYNINQFQSQMKLGKAYYFKQINDLDAVVEVENSIHGLSIYEFCGGYDGNGKNINAPEGSTSNGIALFDNIWGKIEIKNITLNERENFPISLITNIANDGTDAVISNIQVKSLDGKIVQVNNGNFGFIVIGSIYGGNNVLIENCNIYASVQNMGTCTAAFVGQAIFPIPTTIKNCANYGKIIGTSYAGLVYGNPSYNGNWAGEYLNNFKSENVFNYGTVRAIKAGYIAYSESEASGFIFNQMYQENSVKEEGTYETTSYMNEYYYNAYMNASGEFLIQPQDNSPSDYYFKLVFNVFTIKYYYKDGKAPSNSDSDDKGYYAQSNGRKVLIPIPNSNVMSEVTEDWMKIQSVYAYDYKTAVEKGVLTEGQEVSYNLTCDSLKVALVQKDSNLYVIFENLVYGDDSDFESMCVDSSVSLMLYSFVDSNYKEYLGYTDKVNKA